MNATSTPVWISEQQIVSLMNLSGAIEALDAAGANQPEYDHHDHQRFRAFEFARRDRQFRLDRGFVAFPDRGRHHRRDRLGDII